MGGDGVGCALERHEGSGGKRVSRDGAAGGVHDADTAVDRDEGCTAEDDAVGELGDGDRGAAAVVNVVVCAGR